jgi:hypothetical protein
MDKRCSVTGGAAVESSMTRNTTRVRPFCKGDGVPQPVPGDHGQPQHVTPRSAHAPHLQLGEGGASKSVGDRTAGARGRGRVVGRGIVFRLAGLGHAARCPCAAPERGGAGVSRRPLRHALQHAGRLEDHLGAARPAAGGLGLHAAPAVLRHDHSEAIRGARLRRHCPFRGGAPNLDPEPRGGNHGDGAKLARARRAALAVRDRRAEGLLAATPRGWPRDPLLRSHEPGGRLGRSLNDRRGRRLSW